MLESSKKIGILILLIIIFSSLAIEYFYNRETFFGRRRRRRSKGSFYKIQQAIKQQQQQQRKQQRKQQQQQQQPISQNEIEQASGTSYNQELENLKRNYKGNLLGSIYKPEKKYKSIPDDIIPNINSMGPFQEKRQKIFDKNLKVNSKWGNLDDVYPSAVKTFTWKNNSATINN